MDKEEIVKFIHFLTASALISIAALVVFVFMYVPTQAIDVDVVVENTEPFFSSDPIVSHNTCAQEIYPIGEIYNLRHGETQGICVHGTITDLNGGDDIDYVHAYLYRNDLDKTCSEDGNNCYKRLNCTLVDNAHPYQVNYQCLINLQYWMDATDNRSNEYESYYWQLEVEAIDLYEQSVTNTNRTFEVYSSLGLDIPEVVDFGTMLNGEETTKLTNFEQVITQQGNVEQNVTVRAPEGIFACESGEIPLTNMSWSLREVGFGHDVTTSVSTEKINTLLQVEKQTDETIAPTKILYWNIAVPNGVSGSCSISLELLAKNSIFL
jgi:hypothetical protein